MKKLKSDNWKPVTLDAAFFQENCSDLIGIEECTDYDDGIYKSSNIQVEGKQRPKKRKRHAKVSSTKCSNPLDLTPSKQGFTGDIRTDKLKQNDFECSINVDHMEAWESFGLDNALIKGLAYQGFTQPTPIQALTLPPAIFGKKDILGAAETGSGKTLAFGLPILNSIITLKQEHNDSEKPLYALILTPTRELAMQIKNHLTQTCKFTGINIATVVGGMAAVKQERVLNQGPEIVVATPGRLWELIQLGQPHLLKINSIRFFVIDETDRMLERGHFQELHNLLERLNLDEEKSKRRQNFVFSATLTFVHELPKYLLNKKKLKGSKNIQELTPEQKLHKIVDTLGVIDPKIIDVSKGTGLSETLTECRITCAFDEKDYYVYYFLQKHSGRTLIFCNSIGCVRRLTTLLGLLGCKPLPLHASMQQRQRLKNLERFKENENAVLVATDVAARGLDIPYIEHVLHYQTPRTTENYIHRSGRTARASKQGITILLTEPTELNNYLKLCRSLNKTEDLPRFPVEEAFLNAVKQRVNLARELDKLELQVRKVNSETGWLEKAAREMDLIVDDVIEKQETKETKRLKKLAEVKRKQLTALLADPIFPKGFTGKYPSLMDPVLVDSMLENKITHKKAVDVVKSVLEEQSKEKRRALYKPKKVKNQGKSGGARISKIKSKNKKFKK